MNRCHPLKPNIVPTGYGTIWSYIIIILFSICIGSPLSAQITFPTAFTANTVFVDAKYGNDTTGLRERSDFPFQTLGAALTTPTRGAQAGDTIEIRPNEGYTLPSNTTITKQNLTINGNGSTISKTSYAGNMLLLNGANGTKIKNVIFDGVRGANTGSSFSDMLVALSGTSNAVFDHCTFQHDIGTAIKLSGTHDNNKIINCTFSDNRNDIFADVSSSSGTNLSIINNRFAGNYTSASYSGAIKLNNPAGTVGRAVIIGNNISGGGEMGIENFNWDYSLIVGNNIDGTTFGISLLAAYNNVTGNSVKGCATVGVELTQSPHSYAADNSIDGNNDAGTQVGLYGYLIANGGGGFADNYSTISGGKIENCRLGIEFQMQRGLVARNLTITNAAGYPQAIRSQWAADLTVEDCEVRIDIPNNAGAVFDVEGNGNAIYSGFRFRNNRIINTNAANSLYHEYFFYGSAPTATYDDVWIEGNRTNVGFCGSGFVLFTNATATNFHQAYNYPPAQNGSGQYGFDDGFTQYSGSFVSSLGLPGVGTNQFGYGTGDGASYSTYNTLLSLWNGMAIYNATTGGLFPNQTTGYYDARNGIWDTKGGFRINSTASWTSGTGSPNGVVTAPVGSLYTRLDGGAGTTLYVKESGSGNIGWTAK